MFAPRPPVVAGALLALVLLAALAGCLGPTRGGQAEASPVESVPPDADPVDADALGNGVLAAAVDEACASGSDSAVVFDGNERARVRAAFDDLRTGNSRPHVRCPDHDRVVAIGLALYQ